MKISHPLAIRFVSLLSSWVLRAWLGTLDYWFLADHPDCVPWRRKRPGLYLFWHEMLLFPTYTHARQGFAVLISQHRDGELIAQILHMLGGEAIRGSATRGGVTALRRILKNRGDFHLAIVPDGPRGPRRLVKTGPIYIASRTGMPVIPIGFAYDNCIRVNNWDHTALPRLGKAARCVAGAPINVPDGLGRHELEPYRLRVQAAMDDVQQRAEKLAADGRSGRPLLSLAQACFKHR